jgi:TonB family protein
MHSKSSFRGRQACLRRSEQPLLLALALATLMLSRASFVAGQRAPMVASLIVCDPPAYENCRRVDGVTSPRVIHWETPVYPLAARRLKLEGVSEVSLVIDDKGVPRNVSTARSIAEGVPAGDREAAMNMDRSALACVRKFRFAPATLDGRPVAVQVKLDMNFHRTQGK